MRVCYPLPQNPIPLLSSASFANFTITNSSSPFKLSHSSLSSPSIHLSFLPPSLSSLRPFRSPLPRYVILRPYPLLGSRDNQLHRFDSERDITRLRPFPFISFSLVSPKSLLRPTFLSPTHDILLSLHSYEQLSLFSITTYIHHNTELKLRAGPEHLQ